MLAPPQLDETNAFYHGYIARAVDGDVIARLEAQRENLDRLLPGITEEASLHRYAPEKWSLRQVLNHITDGERVFSHRALWFARGFDSPLPGYDQDIAAAAAHADDLPWATHVAEFKDVRLGTLALFRNLPAETWMRTGIASGNSFTVRSLAYIIAGHFEHHAAIVRERYL